MISAFREDNTKEGKPGPISMRRVLAFLSFIAACFSAYFTLKFSKQDTSNAFIPCIAFLAFSLIILLGTTISDIIQIVNNVKIKMKGE